MQRGFEGLVGEGRGGQGDKTAVREHLEGTPPLPHTHTDAPHPHNSRVRISSISPYPNPITTTHHPHTNHAVTLALVQRIFGKGGGGNGDSGGGASDGRGNGGKEGVEIDYLFTKEGWESLVGGVYLNAVAIKVTSHPLFLSLLLLPTPRPPIYPSIQSFQPNISYNHITHHHHLHPSPHHRHQKAAGAGTAATTTAAAAATACCCH